MQPGHNITSLENAPEIIKYSEHKRNASDIDRTISPCIDPGDTLAVSGFWRSGTTWLQECLAEILQAKTIFEPFHFTVPATKQLFKYYGIAKKSQSFHELFIPFCGHGALDNHPLLYKHFDRALRADLPGGAVRVLRKDVSESHRTRAVVKFTRGQFSLRAAQNTFAMPIIHVYRDPRAIVASAKMTDWYWLFEHLSLQEQLLEVKDGRAQFFGRYAEAIREYDNDKVARIAAYWALTEKFLVESFADSRGRIIFTSYEELNRQKETLMKKMLVHLGMKRVWNEEREITDKDSFSTSKQRHGASTEERISGWKKVLSSSETATIEFIARRFGFDNRLDEQ